MIKMKKLSENIKVLAAILLIVTVASTVAYAVYTWHMRFQWGISISENIGVYRDADCTTPWTSPYDLGNVVPGTYSYDFYIKNEGTVNVTVTITNENPVGCTASWSQYSITLSPGQVGLLTLNLIITSAGSYDFDFSSTQS